MSTVTDCIGNDVKVSVGRIGTEVNVGDGISVFVGVTGVITITPAVLVNGRRRIIGVAVTMPGVLDEIGVQTGKG
jgi:hypothetical protein